MTLKQEEKELIWKYFNLEREVLLIQERIERARRKFYSQSMATRTIYTDIGIMSKGCDIEGETSILLDCILDLRKRIKDVRKKQRYFNLYLDNLNHDERTYLINKYKHGYKYNDTNVDKELYEEIQEIEEAINFMNGINPEPIEITILDNSNLEKDFNNIAAVLGI